MQNAKLRTVARYVIPAICSNVCFFLFTIVDAIFVGRGVGTNALGAINLAGPTILIVGAVNMLISIGGAAIATGISQTIGLLILLTRFARRQGNLRFGRTKLNARIFRDIVVHGLPEGISQLSNPVMTLCMNFVLIQRIGDLGVNAFSVISYIASFSMTAFLGASEGLQPLFGQSYGAKNEADLKYCLKTGLTISAVGSVLITGLSILLGKPICVLFGTDAATTEYIIKYLPQFAVGFIITAVNVMISAYLYSTERSALSTGINILRSLVINSAVILILPHIFGDGAIWFSLL